MEVLNNENDPRLMTLLDDISVEMAYVLKIDRSDTINWN